MANLQQHLSAMAAAVPTQSLADAVRTAYRDAFKQALADGRAKPLLMPFSLMAPFVVPALWLAIPHAPRPWLYHTRWLVMAFVVWSNIDHVLYASSTNMACAYGAGLAATWGTMLSMNLLIWTRPQSDAARTLRVRTVRTVRAAKSAPLNGEEPNGHADANGNGLRHRKAALRDAAKEHQQDEEPEYVWQPYPADGSFLERLGWAMDLVLCFRCAGWNWSISSIPHPAAPRTIGRGDGVDMASIPQVTRSGYKQYGTVSDFVQDRLRKMIIWYLVLDFLAVFMMKDPYFILGPVHHNYNLPPHLQRVPPWLLLAYREIFSLAGVYAAIEGIFGVADLAQFWLVRRFFPSRGGLWQFATTFGSFEHVLDRGLAGWWGAFWHQTFRMQFLAPWTYLVNNGYLKKGTLPASIVALLVSFLHSGILHASGSLTSIPRTKVWRSPAFFLLQAVGIVIQKGLSHAIEPYVPHPPRTVSRIVNLSFTLVWLYLTARFFIDDMASSGVWLLEPVPISPLRLFGFGHPGDHWWRWDRDAFPRLHAGEYWWQSGIAF